MKRNNSSGSIAQSNKENIKILACKKCGHNRAWRSRGIINPTYVFKCTRCGAVTK
jgi:DNA-directed RNA polymerase subunit RPC12/RpoP